MPQGQFDISFFLLDFRLDIVFRLCLTKSGFAFELVLLYFRLKKILIETSVFQKPLLETQVRYTYKELDVSQFDSHKI